MCAFQLFFCAYLSLGRVAYSLLSDQALMEMLLEGFDERTRNKFQDNNGMYLDVCEGGCIKCDQDERVVEIDIVSIHSSGSVNFFYVPPKVNVLKVTPLYARSKLTGSVDLARLPEGMEVLDVKRNQLTGGADLTQLPGGMIYLFIETNQLSGEIEFTHLPVQMNSLFLQDNQLTGGIDLTQLPDGMECLSLKNNQFTGEIDLTHLPRSMRELYLYQNKLTGEINLIHLLDGMKELFLQKNDFIGGID